MAEVVRAPWTQDQVDSLNTYQASGAFHPYTCGRSGEHVLVATAGGWRCLEDDYQQDWAHAFTADWSWRAMADATWAALVGNKKP